MRKPRHIWVAFGLCLVIVLAVGLVLYLVMPKFFSAEARRILRPGPLFAIGLALAFLLFGLCFGVAFPHTPYCQGGSITIVLYFFISHPKSFITKTCSGCQKRTAYLTSL